jgi:lipopolysaccharide/colanic/teichoic acid biosynthesis glycosyltransferase
MQTRIGQFGRSFRILKFRTLHAAQSDAAAETLVTKDDHRVTPAGRFLRYYSLDELPQLLNVLAGEMSLVGPRPHAASAKADGHVYRDVMPDYLLRYRAKPGMTGWAQVNGWRGNTDTADKLHRRVEFDFHYIQSWSMALDLYILIRTIPSIFAPTAKNV